MRAKNFYLGGPTSNRHKRGLHYIYYSQNHALKVPKVCIDTAPYIVQPYILSPLTKRDPLPAKKALDVAVPFIGKGYRLHCAGG